MTRTFLAILGTPLLLAIPSHAEEKWQLSPAPRPPSLAGFMEAADLSGIALSGKYAAIASDELAFAQFGSFQLESDTIQFSAAIPLPTQDSSPTGKKKKNKKSGAKSKAPSEADLEGVAWVPGENAFFFTGSHGVGKKKGDFQPLRCRIWKVPFNPVTGTADAAAITSSSLLPWLETSPAFRDHLRQPLQSNGFNIEGLAWHMDQLWFGTRGPCTDGHAHLIAITPADLFRSSGTGIQPNVHRIPLGDGRGIREIASIKGGLLVLTGNACAEPSDRFPVSLARSEDASFQLFFVPINEDGIPGAPSTIGNVSAPGGKAEGLLVLEDSATSVHIAIIHDGIDQGGATSYFLRRPDAPSAP